MTLEQQQLYRELLNTIDFFSQKMHIDQIVHYGYQIFEDLTLPEAGGIYTLNEAEDTYIPRYSRGYEELPNIAFNEVYNEFARKNGFLLDKPLVQKRYFKESFLLQYDIHIILPLIIEDRLFGFIIAKENQLPRGIKNREFLNRFIDLLNLSLEKAENFQKTRLMMKEIDKRKFNLDSFTQTMNILMTAFDRKYIVKMCLDVIRELTSSAVTSIALECHDNTLGIAAYKDILNHKECFVNLLLREDIEEEVVVLHVERDFDSLCNIFENPQEFHVLEAEYVVLLVKEKIIGCITIGVPVSGVAYDHQLLEQIKNLATMMYIAIDNANQFLLLERERNRLDAQLTGLKHLNRSIAIINDAESLEELCSHVMDTLQYGFGVDSGCIYIHHGQQSAYQSIGSFEHEGLTPQQLSYLEEMSDIRVEYTEPLANPLTSVHSNCFVSIPIILRDYQQTCMGHLIINKTMKALEESQLIIFETLANSISPLIRQFITIGHYKATYVKKSEIALYELYERYKKDSDYFHIPFYVFARRSTQKLFGDTCRQSAGESGDTIEFSGLSIVFTNSSFMDNLYEAIDTSTFETLTQGLTTLL